MRVWFFGTRESRNPPVTYLTPLSTHPCIAPSWIVSIVSTAELSDFRITWQFKTWIVGSNFLAINSQVELVWPDNSQPELSYTYQFNKRIVMYRPVTGNNDLNSSQLYRRDNSTNELVGDYQFNKWIGMYKPVTANSDLNSCSLMNHALLDHLAASF